MLPACENENLSNLSNLSSLKTRKKTPTSPLIYVIYIYLKFIYINFKKEEPPNLSPQMRDLSNERFERFERKTPKSIKTNQLTKLNVFLFLFAKFCLTLPKIYETLN